MCTQRPACSLHFPKTTGLSETDGGCSERLRGSGKTSQGEIPERAQADGETNPVISNMNSEV